MDSTKPSKFQHKQHYNTMDRTKNTNIPACKALKQHYNITDSTKTPRLLKETNSKIAKPSN